MLLTTRFLGRTPESPTLACRVRTHAWEALTAAEALVPPFLRSVLPIFETVIFSQTRQGRGFANGPEPCGTRLLLEADFENGFARVLTAIRARTVSDR